MPFALDIGFTGTRLGMSPEQKVTYRKLFNRIAREYPDHWIYVHLGDCFGADDDAYWICGEDGNHKFVITVGHLPENKSMATNHSYHEYWPAKPYMERNQDIVNECQVLLATPGEYEEQLRSGTWSTVRKARKAKKKIVVIYPNGSYNIEDWTK